MNWHSILTMENFINWWRTLTLWQKILLGVLGSIGIVEFLVGIPLLFTSEPTMIFISFFWFIIFGIACWQIQSKNNYRKKFTEAGGIDTILVGNYLVGLPNVSRRVVAVKCAVFPDYFVFMDGKRELDSIARDSINQIMVDSKSQITQRLTATRMLALGVFSLAAPKKRRNQEFCLVIDWDDHNGTRQNTVVDFLSQNGNALANQATNTLKRYMKPKVDRLKVNEKKCPHCTEIIKREARICKHCHSSVE